LKNTGEKAVRFKSKQKKIFVIGHNKTATTSVGAAIASLGFKLGNQPEAELFIEDWARRDFRNIVKYCKTADAFQDIPFSLDYTYQVMDYVFPGSKFVLTVRRSSLEWYESLTQAHTMLIGKNRLPTADDLKAHPYRKTGWLWRALELIYGMEENSVYDKTICIRHYEAHNNMVIDYFQHRQEDLLILNAADSDAMKSLCNFLGVEVKNHTMPHLKKSKDVD
jgi:hypothetical protein